MQPAHLWYGFLTVALSLVKAQLIILQLASFHLMKTIKKLHMSFFCFAGLIKLSSLYHCWCNFKVLSLHVAKVQSYSYSFWNHITLVSGSKSIQRCETFRMIVLNLSLSVSLLWNQSAYKVLRVIFLLNFLLFFYDFIWFYFLNSWSHSTTTKRCIIECLSAASHLLPKICSNNDKK